MGDARIIIWKEATLLLVLLTLFAFHSWSLNFTQDDAYISYRYVENFTEGHGLVFNYGERVEGYTNFLWIMILSLVTLVGLPMILVSKVLGVVFGAGTVVLTWLFGREYSDHKRWLVPFIAPAFLVANGALCYWVIGGLETGLFIFLFSLTLYVEMKRPSLTPFILVLAALTRPEGGLLFGIVFLYRWIILRHNMKQLAVFTGSFFGLLLPYAIFKLIHFGDLLPNPFYAKTGLSVEYLKSGIGYAWLFLKHYGAFGLFFILPLLFRRSLPNIIKLMWMTVVIYTAYIILVGGDVLKVHRFFLPILPAFYLIAAFSAWSVLTTYKKAKWPGLVVAAFVGGYIIWGILIPLDYIKQTGYLETAFIRKMTLVTENLRDIDRSDFSIATTTIGKVSYTLKGHKVIDMLGLTDRHIAKNPEKIEGMQTTWKERNFNTAYLLEQKPDYILFSTGHKASAPAERALILNSQFRENYSTIGFLSGNRLKVIWKKRGNFSSPNRQLPTTEFADLMYDGLNLMNDKKHTEAVEAFEKAAELCNHDFALAEFFIGQCSGELGQTEKMVKHCRKAIELDSYNLEARMDLSTYYSSIGNVEEVRKLSNEILTIAPWLRR
ncbi:MAG: hypothetical protein ABIK83_13640 [Candidatus Zixiibacteriota bacterium]